MLGSDYPFPLGEHHPGKLIESIEDIDEDVKVVLLCDVGVVEHISFLQKQLLAGNVLAFLGLDPAKFTTTN